jgi:drug/metabolite transporter (DMT)-like permease
MPDMRSGVAGYADGLLSGATWGIVAVLLDQVASRIPGHWPLATPLVLAAGHDLAAAVFLLGRLGIARALPSALRLVRSRLGLTIVACSFLGGTVFMGGYLIALVQAGPSYALTATAMYPVFGALFARRLLGQRLNRIAWLGVIVAVAGAAITAIDAGSAADGAPALIGIVIALVADAGPALEGIIATRAMMTVDPDTAMAVRQMLSAIQMGLLVLVVPHGESIAAVVVRAPGLGLPLIVAGFIGGYSWAAWYRSITKIGIAKAMTLNITYAMWGVLFAWLFVRTAPSPLVVAGCVVVSAGAALVIMSGERLDEGKPDGPEERIG